MPENYTPPGPDRYSRPQPGGSGRPGPGDYRRPAPDGYRPPAPEDYRRPGPGGSWGPGPGDYGRPALHECPPPAPEDYRGPGPAYYGGREPDTHGHPAPARRGRGPGRWLLVTGAVVLACVLAGVGYAVYPRPVPVPLTARSYAGALVLDASGSRLASWNKTSSYCPSSGGFSGDGTVATDAAGDVTLNTSGKPGSCAALISPGRYSSGVIEARVDFPALPGKPHTIADWTSFWLTYGAAWPADGELDAVEVEPVNGVNAVSWHSGTVDSEFSASTDGFYATKLPIEGPNLTPGWHTVDVVYTKGFFAVYYDGKLYSSYKSGNVTGSALNIMLTTSVTPDTSTEEQKLGGPPVNSDNTPATIAVKYIRVWSYK